MVRQTFLENSMFLTNIFNPSSLLSRSSTAKKKKRKYFKKDIQEVEKWVKDLTKFSIIYFLLKNKKKSALKEKSDKSCYFLLNINYCILKDWL